MKDQKNQIKSFVDWAEKTTKKVVSGVPNLPKGGQKWLAENIWWLVALGAVLLVVGIIRSLGGYLGAPVWYFYSGWWSIVFIISMALQLAVAVLLAKTVVPLKKNHPKGWRLLFFATLVGFVAAVVPPILGFYLPYIVTVLAAGVFGVLISAYFLHQIKPYFGGSAKASAKKK